MNQFRADDRVLLLVIPSHDELALLARTLLRGTIVAIGTAEEVTSARRQMAEFHNVMLLEASPNHVPARDGAFTKILVPAHLDGLLPHISAELHRLLATGGEIVRASRESALRV